MPKDLSEDIKTFLLFLRGDEKKSIKPIARSVTIKKINKKTKFKLRCPRYLYTLKIDDEEKADKIKGSIPSDLKKIDLNSKKGKGDKKKEDMKK